MALCTPDQVIKVGALSPELFNLPDQPSMESLVGFAITGVDAWMQDHMGGNYNLTQFPWQIVQQQNGQMYLALERLTDTLKAEKTYGSHEFYISEDSGGYERLIMVNWGQRAMECLDRWVTIEQISRNFAMPIFSTYRPIPEVDDESSGLDPLSAFYTGLLDRARGIANPDLGTVRR